jgi:hypothetical protein
MICIVGSFIFCGTAMAAPKEDQIFINAHAWDYLQLQVSKDSELLIKITCDSPISIFIFDEAHFKEFQATENRGIATVADGKSTGAVNSFEFGFKASENTNLYLVVLNDNSAQIEVKYNYEFKTPSIAGFEISIFMFTGVGISIIMIYFLKKRV